MEQNADKQADQLRLMEASLLHLVRPHQRFERTRLHLGLSRMAFEQASASYRGWREGLGDDWTTEDFLAAQSARPTVEQAISYHADRVVPPATTDLQLEPLRREAALWARVEKAEGQAGESGDAEAVLAVFEEALVDDDWWIRAALPFWVNQLLEWFSASAVCRARLVGLVDTLCHDEHEQVRTSVALYAPEGFPLPSSGDPSPRVRAAHPLSSEPALFMLARHPELEVACAVATHVRASEKALLVVAYRLGLPFGSFGPGRSSLLEHEIALINRCSTPEALAMEPGYWWPDELVDPSSSVTVRYEWFQEGGKQVAATIQVQATQAKGFTAAELRFSVLRALAEVEAHGPHFSGDTAGLGKQTVLSNLEGKEGRWFAWLRK